MIITERYREVGLEDLLNLYSGDFLLATSSGLKGLANYEDAKSIRLRVARIFSTLDLRYPAFSSQAFFHRPNRYHTSAD